MSKAISSNQYPLPRRRRAFSEEMQPIQPEKAMKGAAAARRIFIVVALSALLLLIALLTHHQWQTIPVHKDTKSTNQLVTALRNREREYSVLSDEIVYRGYARVYSRIVRFPNNKQFAFDVWGRVWKNDSFSVVTVVPFDRETRTFTLIREYNIAHAKFVYAWPQGQVETSRHDGAQQAAAAELEEEAQLKCQEWSDLLGKEAGSGSPQDKYQREVVHYYLCTDALHVDNAAERDLEEDMDVIHGVTATQVRELVAAGLMQSNNIAAGLMAIDRLRRLGHLPASA